MSANGRYRTRVPHERLNVTAISELALLPRAGPKLRSARCYQLSSYAGV